MKGHGDSRNMVLIVFMIQDTEHRTGYRTKDIKLRIFRIQDAEHVMKDRDRRYRIKDILLRIYDTE